MARLRKCSDASYSDDRTQQQCTGPLRTRLDATADNRTKTRLSPRKKAVRSYISSLGSDSEGDLHDARVLPAPKRVGESHSRQIRLAPLKAEGVLSGTRTGLDLEGERRRRRAHGLGKTSRSVMEDGSGELELVPRLQSIGLQAKANFGRRVSGSDFELSSGSESDLPSASKLLAARPRKAIAEKVSTTPSIDLSQALQSLQIPDSKPTADSIRRFSEKSPQETTTSDKENNDDAFLHFSPPRLHSPRKTGLTERSVTPPAPPSPSKGRLLSPSKKAARVPTPPLRPSLDAFWNAETVNDWNDQYSPKKEWRSPKKFNASDDLTSTSPTQSPRKPPSSPIKRTKAEIEAKRTWEETKHSIAEAFLAELDERITNNQISGLARSTGGVRFIWSKTLKSTAGRANWRREKTTSKHTDGSTTVVHRHFASIELAEKVIDDEHRLLNVIAHEFCHLCNFMVSGVKDHPHGKQFKEWGRKTTLAFRDRGVEVTTKHSYEIDFKYVWRCTGEECGAEFKRHSKSIDPKRHTCGQCRSRSLQIKPAPRKNADVAGGAGAGYAGFVKLQFASVKKGMPGASHKEVMEAVGRKYKEMKKEESGKDEMSRSIEEIVEVVEVLSSPEAVTGTSSQDSGNAFDVDSVARKLDFVTLED